MKVSVYYYDEFFIYFPIYVIVATVCLILNRRQKYTLYIFTFSYYWKYNSSQGEGEYKSSEIISVTFVYHVNFPFPALLQRPALL